MEVTNGEIWACREPLGKLAQMELPVKTSLQVARLAIKFGEQFKVIEDVRNGLIRKYGKPDEKTKQISVEPKNKDFPKFVADFNELMAQTTELVFDKVKLPSMVDGKPFQIEPSILVPLEKFVEVE